ncbi:SCO0930 family lipoprotein [Streptomyces sp. NPDC088789]|uniref:SCO0930 family lipoprotein n=1 Tax=Streptomyces sp. NPDC088789 TaxID=3365899 RepID=UPI0037F4B5B0
MRKTRNAAITATGVATALVLLTACGGERSGGDAAPEDARSTVAAAEAGAAQDSGARPTAAGTLSVWRSEALGPVVTDSAGFTLYRFDDDTASPPRSTCEGDCATTWPPVLAADAEAAEGMDPALVGTVARSDGTRQLTLDGWPLYRYVKDTRPRQTNGQGVGGTWFAAAPDGGKAGPDGAGGAGDGGGAGGAKGGDTGALPPLSVREDAELGDIVRDAKGRTLYRFTEDTDWPMTSACTGACLEKWKPATMLDKDALDDVEGIDRKDVIAFERPDGTRQLTIDCWPLYWFTGDQEPGDTAGQGVGGTWFAVRADGTLAK